MDKAKEYAKILRCYINTEEQFREIKENGTIPSSVYVKLRLEANLLPVDDNEDYRKRWLCNMVLQLSQKLILFDTWYELQQALESPEYREATANDIGKQVIVSDDGKRWVGHPNDPGKFTLIAVVDNLPVKRFVVISCLNGKFIEDEAYCFNHASVVDD